MDAGRTYFGQEVSLGLAEGGGGIVTDKNFATFANDDLKACLLYTSSICVTEAIREP